MAGPAGYGPITKPAIESGTWHETDELEFNVYRHSMQVRNLLQDREGLAQQWGRETTS